MPEQISAFDPSKITIITTTFYRRWVPGQLQWNPDDQVTPDVVDKVRGDLAIETITTGAEKGAKVIVVDGVNNRPFRQALDRRNVLIFNETDRGMSSGRQQGFQIANTMPDGIANLWIEPEKISIVEDCLEPLMSPIFRNEADMTIPLRGDEAFSTYPDYQVEDERESNRLWNDLLRAEGLLPSEHSGYDVWIGPRGWNRDITGLFLKRYKVTDPEASLIRPDEYCNAIFFPVVAALVEGRKVLSVIVPYRHPEIQKAIEQNSPVFRAKRKHQQTTILETTKEYLALLRGESSRLALIA